MAIERRFVTTTAGRQVHYRRAGRGPAVVLCHESPLSSLSLVDLVETLARRFTVIALDNPGYGNSDQLAIRDPEIGDFADALAETLDALGIRRAALYGAHTGAEIVLDFAARYPERTAGVVCDGLPIFDSGDTTELLASYLPRWEPRWDGGHLLWAWNRYRDQHLFWPWFRRERDARIDADMASPQWLHEGVLDMLRSGDDFRIGYQAAFRYHAYPVVERLAVPAVITAREDDLLITHLDLLPDPLPPGVFAQTLPRERPAWAAELLRLYLALPRGDVAPAAPAVEPRGGGRITRDYVDTPYGQLFARRLGEGAPGEPPLLMLHASPGSARMLEPLQRELAAAGRATIALDTLGNGESDKPGWDAPRMEEYARVVGAALDALGLAQVDVYGSHTGAMIGLELGVQQPARVRRLVLDGVTMFDEAFTQRLLADYTPPLEPRWDGGHLLWAWEFLRDQTLFWPWFDRSREAARKVEPIALESLHTWVVELLKSGSTYPKGYRAAFSYPTRDKLRLLTVPTLVCSTPDDMLAEFCEEASAIAPNATATLLAVQPREQAATISRFLEAAA